MQDDPQKREKFEIEKMAELNEMRRQAGEQGYDEYGFDNDGNIVAKNRAYRRNLKRLWRAVFEKRKSIHHYTKKRNKTNRRTKKLERQNRKKGRQ